MSDGNGLSTPLETIPLGPTGLTITKLGIGAGRLHARDAVHPTTRRRAMETIHTALAAGIRYFDTAPMYGHGESESTLGDALAGHPLGQESTVATKVGNYPADVPYTAQAAIDSVRSSLTRLHLPTVDLVQVHELKPHTVDRVLAPGGVVDGLDDLRDRQVVRHIGFTTSDIECALRALDSGRFETAMLWRRADILDDRLIVAAATVAQRAGVAVVVAAPLATGLLTTGGEESGRQRRQPLPQALARVRSLRDLCDDHGVQIEALSLQFALRQSGVTAIVTGVQEVHHVHQQLAWLHAPLPDAIWPDVAILRAGWSDDPATVLAATVWRSDGRKT